MEKTETNMTKIVSEKGKVSRHKFYELQYLKKRVTNNFVTLLSGYQSILIIIVL